MTRVDMNSIDNTEVPEIVMSSIFTSQVRNNTSLPIWTYACVQIGMNNIHSQGVFIMILRKSITN